MKPHRVSSGIGPGRCRGRGPVRRSWRDCVRSPARLSAGRSRRHRDPSCRPSPRPGSPCAATWAPSRRGRPASRRPSRRAGSGPSWRRRAGCRWWCRAAGRTAGAGRRRRTSPSTWPVVARLGAPLGIRTRRRQGGAPSGAAGRSVCSEWPGSSGVDVRVGSLLQCRTWCRGAHDRPSSMFAASSVNRATRSFALCERMAVMGTAAPWAAPIAVRSGIGGSSTSWG